MLLDESGKPKFELSKGQYKSLHNERVILIPGPAHEIQTVRRIYNMFLDKKWTFTEIAQTLNVEGVAGEFGESWSRSKVLSVLSNEKYIGNAIYNRASTKLKGKRKKNPKSE